MSRQLPFKPIKLYWREENGEHTEYVIPPDRVWGAIKVVEDIVFSPRVQSDIATMGQLRPTAVAEGFGALLRYAGAELEDWEVYMGLFGSEKADQEDVETAASAIYQILQFRVAPEDVRKESGEEAGSEGKPQTGRGRGASSKRRTRRRSGSRSGGRGTSSGGPTQKSSGG